jgi:3-dehydroquinate synthase
MRGLSWIYVPTTLLGMADSCIGGKSSINVGPYKNLVGTFCPPQLVLIDPALAETLSVEQRVAGLCEAAKICFCRGEAPFKAYTDLSPKVDSPIATLTDVIALSLASKKWFIEVDEFDRGERLLLNFGHTFGHAVETASDFRISHGVAVGLGMIAARAFGFGLGRRHDAAATPEALFAHIDALLRQVPGLDRAVRTLEPDSLMSAFAADKKHSRDQFAVIVVDELGGVERLRLPRDAATTARVLSAFEATLERYAA